MPVEFAGLSWFQNFYLEDFVTLLFFVYLVAVAVAVYLWEPQDSCNTKK